MVGEMRGESAETDAKIMLAWMGVYGVDIILPGRGMKTASQQNTHRTLASLSNVLIQS